MPESKYTPPPEASNAAGAGFSVEVLRRAPHLYYRSARKDEFGKVVIAALAAPEEARVVTQVSCERLYMDRRGGLCLAYDRGALVPNFRAHLLTPELTTSSTLPTAGFPSRARLSRNGSYAAITVFTTGDSYDSDFSTRTNLIDRSTAQAMPDLEQYTVLKDDQVFKHVDFNFWGVTFFDDTHFYATLGTRERTYLVTGDASTRTLRVLREDIECPSVSPDGKHIAFKRRAANPAVTHLHVLDTQTWNEAPLTAETRHVDDQVEWLDDTHVLYAVVDPGKTPEAALNLWLTSITDGGPPRLFVRGATSPSIVR